MNKILFFNCLDFVRLPQRYTQTFFKISRNPIYDIINTLHQFNANLLRCSALFTCSLYQVTRGYEPIIRATVEAIITNIADGQSSYLPLYDQGSGKELLHKFLSKIL